MIALLLLCAAPSLAQKNATGYTAGTGVKVGGPEVALTDKERRKLHVFFSNFAEADVQPFKAGKMTDKAMIEFAISHSQWNGSPHGSTEPAPGGYRLLTSRVDATCLYFLGRKPSAHQSVPGRNFDGKGYRIAASDGEDPNFAQIQKLRNVGGGLYEADVNIYIPQQIGWDQAQDPPEKWKPLEDYSGANTPAAERLPKLYQRMKATIRKVTQGAKSRYILVEYQLVHSYL